MKSWLQLIVALTVLAVAIIIGSRMDVQDPPRQPSGPLLTASRLNGISRQT